MLIVYLALVIGSAAGQNENYGLSKFYANDEVLEFSCSVEFNRPLNLDCACVNGLWLLYNNCNEHITISGQNQHCARLPSISVSPSTAKLLRL
ncbi:unnamed protein product [Orchesella dallaii]|uniref:Uncharacterized protein n=1 Tax=Orchesella dallaii TaxID=48710 RepID=A0ABP1Q9V3_9HEXA